MHEGKTGGPARQNTPGTYMCLTAAGVTLQHYRRTFKEQVPVHKDTTRKIKSARGHDKQVDRMLMHEGTTRHDKKMLMHEGTTQDRVSAQKQDNARVSEAVGRRPVIAIVPIRSGVGTGNYDDLASRRKPPAVPSVWKGSRTGSTKETQPQRTSTEPDSLRKWHRTGRHLVRKRTRLSDLFKVPETIEWAKSKQRARSSTR
ncbi:hypothetical protein C8F04DRAFT_1359423 [Mycena alexandri]|uniref:Uncharacterized protein n=1 Tax=Mycena alexandri TaxID=1745969 RepID=A0AAD6STB9_9AGAR|nr:hypothetical protein C8F04DRAFT_1359423 [Mycena alexandri]